MEFSRIDGGTAREVFLVRDGTKFHVMKVAKDCRSSKREYRLLSRKLPIQSPEIFCFSVLPDGTSITWEEWIDGVQMSPSELDLKSGVSTLKCIHGLYPGKSISAGQTWDSCNREFGRLWKSPPSIMDDYLQPLREKWRRLCNSISENSSYPKVLLHGDFHPGNLIRRPSGIYTVIDWERWGIGHPFRDLADLVRGVRGSSDVARRALMHYSGIEADLPLLEAFCILKALKVIFWKEKIKRMDVGTDLAILEMWTR